MQLGLPSDRPLLRIANALVFGRSTGSATGSSRLADVHVGLPSSGVPGGTVHLVDGSYEYYHYMQACSHPPLKPQLIHLIGCLIFLSGNADIAALHCSAHLATEYCPHA